ncbi:hypothetical protein FLA_2092 [Filimonas lacunae]|nr:hypothetical protein FLA_2092 [Filimonas lacunae]
MVNGMKKFIPFIAGAVVIVLVLVLMPARKKQPQFDGKVTLNVRDKIPYGCYASYHLLPDLFPGVKVELNRNEPGSWKEVSLDSSGQVLLIVTKFFDPSESDLDYLTALAQKGNCVLISAVEMSYDAKKFFKVHEQFLDVDKGDKAIADEPMLNVSHQFGVSMDTNVVHGASWFIYPGLKYGNEFQDIDTSIAHALGYTASFQVNLVGIHASKGSILLHSTPLTFSNFFLLYESNYRYLQQLVSLAPFKPTRIVWDEYFLNNVQKDSHNNGGNLLGVLLSYENFRWAFWMAIIVIGLYLVTGIQRRQRMIPQMAKPVNESLEFVSVIGKLYYEKGDHANLGLKLAQFFLEHVRTKYHLDTQYVNSSFAVHLAAKAGITPEMAGQLVDYITEAQMGSITADRLASFYGLLDTFYKTT